MAVIGVQLVVTMVMLSILHKFAIHYSFARWLLAHRLVRYLQPTEQAIKRGITTLESERKSQKQQQQLDEKTGKHGKSKSSKQLSHRGKKSRSEKAKVDESLVSKKLSLTLEAERVNALDLIQLNYYKEYQWLIDFALYASVVYILSEVQFYLIPGCKEMNLSLIWCLLVMGFTTKLLLSITGIYFQGNDDAIGERSMVLISGCLFFLLSMIVLIGDENFLEFGLNPAYSAFNSSATQFFQAHGLHESSSSKSVTSKLLFKFWLAVWSGLIGALFIFPGLRFAQMHKDSLDYAEGKPIRQLLFHTAFVSPLAIILFWVKPIGRVYFTEKEWPSRGILLTTVSFDSLRIVVILLIVLFRLILMPKYLQAYLNLAPRKLSRLTRESGKIKTEVIQRTVSGVFYYLCVVCLQYVCPLMLIFFTTILMKNMGDHQWSSLFTGQTSGKSEAYTFGSSDQFSLKELKAIFNPIFFRGILGYMTWWLSVVWFTTSVIGFVYHSYFSRESQRS